jgi:hypothetical protein
MSQNPYQTVTILANGQSITGSFYKVVTLVSGSVGAGLTSPAHFRGLKDQNGNSLIPSTLSTNGLFVPPGTTIEALITSASLDGTSAPILLYNS